MNRSVMRILTNAIILVSLFFSVFTRCMLNNIKGTDTILHEDYKYLSLVHGAIAWETGVIRRLYDFGQIFPKYKEDKQGRKLIENYEYPDETSKLVRLIHVLFYRIPGSTGPADFGVTTQLASEDPNVVVALVAEFIVQCGQLQQQREQFKQAITYAQDVVLKLTQEQVSTLGKNVTQASLEQIIKDAQEKPWDRNAGERFVSTCKSIAKNLPQISQELEMHRQNAQKFFDLLIASTQNLKKLVKPVVFKSKEPIDSFIFEALNESDPDNINALYPEHTVEMVLLAFMYKKYSAHRAVLKMFYDALNNKLDRKLLMSNLDEQWVKDSFKSVTQVQALETIQNIFAEADIMQSIEQHFAGFVYNAFQIRAFPAPVGYEKATYEYAKGKKTAPFSDCMDNAMRNFINLYAYEVEQNKFTLEKLLATTGLTKVHPDLVNFLKSFGDVNKASELEAHNAWLQVISNIPYGNYRQMADGITGQATRSEFGKGYIAVPEHERNNTLLDWLKNNGYQVSSTDQYCYEIRASLKNIIIALDYLLQLNLFMQAGGLAKEFMRPDFISTYFPKLCMSLKATGFLSTQADAEQGELGKNFDALDYTVTALYATLEMAEITSEIKTYSGHGQLKLVQAKGSLEESKFIELLKKIKIFTNQQSSLSLLVTNVLCKRQINFEYLISNPEYLYINLFATSLENTGLLKQIINSVFSIITTTTHLKVKIYTKDLLLRLAEKQPDVVQMNISTLGILKKFISRLSDVDVMSSGIDSLFKEITETAEKRVADKNKKVRRATFGLLKALFEKNQISQEAIQIAEKGFADKDWEVHGLAIDLFKILINKDLAFDEAIEVAKEAIKQEVRNISALELFDILVKKDQALKEAVEAAKKGITDEVGATRSLALDIFENLVKKDQAFKEAIEAAEKGITDHGESIRDSALDLFKQLIVKVPDETKKVIQKMLDDRNLKLADDIKLKLGELLKK